jgi:D-sedoheptulose 7-phosphate isomerase
MNLKVEKILDNLFVAYPELQKIKKNIFQAYEILVESYSNDGKLLIAGNGGSCCDSSHIVGELMKGFIKKREISSEDRVVVEGVDQQVLDSLYNGLQYGLMAIDLTAQQGLITAVSNDNGPELIFAQQVWAYGKKGDVFLGLSTSGNSKNIIAAGIAAKSKGLKTIGFCGDHRSEMEVLFDVTINVPSLVTFKTQELHLPVYHALCLMLEETFF